MRATPIFALGDRQTADRKWQGERVLDASLSAEEGIELAASISSPDSNGVLPDFCLAIAQVSDWDAKVLQAKSKT